MGVLPVRSVKPLTGSTPEHGLRGCEIAWWRGCGPGLFPNCSQFRTPICPEKAGERGGRLSLSSTPATGAYSGFVITGLLGLPLRVDPLDYLPGQDLE